MNDQATDPDPQDQAEQAAAAETGAARTWLDQMEVGNYNAVILKSSLEETKESKLPQFYARVRLDEFWDSAAKVAVPCAFEMDVRIILGFKDGRVNTKQIDALKDALGWDGENWETLHGDRFVGREVRAKIEIEEGSVDPNTGKKYDARWRVTWLNGRGTRSVNPDKFNRFKLGSFQTPNRPKPPAPPGSAKAPGASQPRAPGNPPPLAPPAKPTTPPQPATLPDVPEDVNAELASQVDENGIPF